MKYFNEIFFRLFEIIYNKNTKNIKCFIFKKNLIEFIDKTKIYCLAIDRSDLLMIKYLNNVYPSYGTISWAAENGHYQIVKHLHENDCPWDSRIIAWAAKNGHFKIVKYLHENGCPMDEYAIDCAGVYGHFEIVKYLYVNGCPVDRTTINDAEERGHFCIGGYLRDNGYDPW